MNRIYLIICLFIFCTTTLFAQKEANNWIFGFSNLLDFNTDPPTPDVLPFFDFFIERNSVSMSNGEGELIFYSDGFSVTDKNGDPMPNSFGLQSDPNSASHPVFAIPKPNTSEEYYLITSTLFQGNGGMSWSEINMTLNNNAGDVTSNKNILLTSNSVGKITAVQHENLTDIWVIGHEWNTSSYKAWLATENGFENPVISNGGTFISDANFVNGFGQIKTSPDGRRIAAVYQGLNIVEIFDFDNATGQMTHKATLNTLIQPYGVEFSPNGRFLYVSQNGSNFLSGLRQYDLEAGNASQIQNSTIILGVNFPTEAGGLQLGPDGKIYVITFAFDVSLGVINEPNLSGLACDFDDFGVQLQAGEVLFGLPSFFHRYIQKPYFEYSGLCPGGITEFDVNQFELVIDSLQWDFGEPASGANNFSTELAPTHQYSGSGAYNVKLTVYSNGEVFQSNSIVHIAPIGVSLGPDQTVCDNQVFTMNAFTQNASYLWSNNSTASSISTVLPGTFWVEVSVDTCGTLRDTITINHIPAPDVELGPDRGLCNGVAEILDATDPAPDATYQWSNGMITPSVVIDFGGNYGVTVSYPNGCTDSDNINLNFDEVVVDPAQANLKCFGDSSGVALVFPVLGILPFSYEWSNGDTLYTTNGLAAGTHTLTVTDMLGCTLVQEFNLNEPSEFNLDIVVNDDNPNTSDPDGAVFLNPSGGTPPYVIEWEAFGELPDPVFNLNAGDYEITITDDKDCEHVVMVTVGGIPVSVDDVSLLEKIQLYPNPTVDFIFVEIPIEEEALEMSMTNVLGQTLSSFFIEKNNKGFQIDVSAFETGIYFLKIKKGEEERICKVNVVK